MENWVNTGKIDHIMKAALFYFLYLPVVFLGLIPRLYKITRGI